MWYVRQWPKRVGVVVCLPHPIATCLKKPKMQDVVLQMPSRVAAKLGARSTWEEKCPDDIDLEYKMHCTTRIYYLQTR